MQCDDFTNKTLLRGLKALQLPIDCDIRVVQNVQPWATKLTQTNCYNCEVAEFYYEHTLIGIMIDDNKRLAFRVPTPYQGAYHVYKALGFKQRVHSYIL